MVIAKLISIDNEIMNGIPVFVGTRVPVASLFEHLEDGISIEEFLEDFPSVSRRQVEDLLHLVSNAFKKQELIERYALVA